MTVEHLLQLIENREVTAADFNQLIESLPKSAVERVQRRVRAGSSGGPSQPVKSVEQRVARDSDTSPMKTAQGRNAVAKRGLHNKRHANQFREALEQLAQLPPEQYADWLANHPNQRLAYLISDRLAARYPHLATLLR